MTFRAVLPSVALCTLLGAVVGGCDERSTRSATQSEVREQSGSRAVAGVPGKNGTFEERRAALLNKIRAADPQKATIERALINERNELGIILSRQTPLDDVPKLLKAMIVQMDQAFPQEDHVAVAYAPTNPPKTIGSARSDARTRDITYQPASTP